MTTSAVHELVHVCLSICTCLYLWLVELEAKCKNTQDKIIKRNNGTHYNRHPQKRVWKKRQKGKNMQEKYLPPSVCSSKTHRVFLWVDLGLRQKGGGKRKDKIQKDFTALKQKEQKIPKQQNKKIDKLARDHMSQFKRRIKNSSQSRRAKQTTNS